MGESDAHSLAASRIDQYLMERTLRRRPEVKTPARAVQPVITISRVLGIPAAEIAERVAGKLGFHVFDRQVLDAVGEDANLGERIVSALDEGSLSAVDVYIAGLVRYDRMVIDRHGFHHMVSRVVRSISLHGSAVIVGRGANFILRGTDTFRVRLTAPLELRATALVQQRHKSEPISLTRARKELREHAERRRRFIWNHFRANINDPEAYDAIFCLRSLDPDLAAGLILDAYCRVTGT
jgi:cytidylate kinase